MIVQERDRGILTRLFSTKLVNPVRIVVFTQNQTGLSLPVHVACQWCKDTVALAQEVGELSDRITVEVRDFLLEPDAARQYDVHKIPAIALVGDQDYGIRFFGIPAGYVFTALIEDLIDVSRGTTDLSPNTKERLAAITTDVHIQVFSTPTCPFCPRAVRIAHQMAIENPLIRADAVEASEFPHLAQKYHVQSVPKIVINETGGFDGALPESTFVLHVLKAANALAPDEIEKFGHQ